MTELIVRRSEGLSGTVEAPPSKSLTHRAVIAASLSGGTSPIHGPLACDDTLATVYGCSALGAYIEMDEDKWTVKGTPTPRTPGEAIDCRDSASTMRFLTSVAALAPGETLLRGGQSLNRRPMGPLLEALEQLGVRCRSLGGDGYPPIIVLGGGISGGRAAIPGDVSSQFISSLLFACPLGKADTSLELTSELESRPYVGMTLQVLDRFGVKVDVGDQMRSYRIQSGQRYRSTHYGVEGDYSSASFLLAAAAATNSAVRVTNLQRDTIQGDRVIIDILESMGAELRIGRDHVEVRGGELKGIDIDARDIPDLVPVLAALACYAKGKTEIRRVERLRIKESDRVSALCDGLAAMGAKVRTPRGTLLIEGPCDLHGALVDPRGDHRMAMAFTIAALGADGETKIVDHECVKKSYPDFFSHVKSLGGELLVSS